MLCDHLEGWNGSGEGSSRERGLYVYIYIYIYILMSIKLFILIIKIGEVRTSLVIKTLQFHGRVLEPWFRN